MSKLILASVFAIVATMSTTASADIEKSVVIQGKSFNKQVVIHPEQFEQFEGKYSLSNGEKLVINKVQNRFYAQIGDGNKVQIVPTQDKSFISKDNSVNIEFENFGMGKANDVKVTYNK
jgi:hypothetical protein